MLKSTEPLEVVSTRDKLREDAYQELAEYYKKAGKSPVGPKLDAHKSELLLEELEKAYDNKVQD